MATPHRDKEANDGDETHALLGDDNKPVNTRVPLFGNPFVHGPDAESTLHGPTPREYANIENTESVKAGEATSSAAVNEPTYTIRNSDTKLTLLDLKVIEMILRLDYEDTGSISNSDDGATDVENTHHQGDNFSLKLSDLTSKLFGYNNSDSSAFIKPGSHFIDPVTPITTTDPVEEEGSWGTSKEAQASAMVRKILNSMSKGASAAYQIDAKDDQEILNDSIEYLHRLRKVRDKLNQHIGNMESGRIAANQASLRSENAEFDYLDSPPRATGYSDDKQNSNSSAARKQHVRQPPSTPQERISPHSLSMPTVPELHHCSNPILVEQYLEERAEDPGAFDAKTRAIKQNLIDAKIERGGSNRLLTNEYTVELASRLDAEKSEKFAGQFAWQGEEFPKLPVDSTQVEEHQEASLAAESEDVAGFTQNVDDQVSTLTDLTNVENTGVLPSSTQQVQLDEENEDIKRLAKQQPVDKPSHKSESKTASEPAKSSENAVPTDHLYRPKTSGTIRSQKTTTREIKHTGEKVTTKTLIEVIETYNISAGDRSGPEDMPPAEKSKPKPTIFLNMGPKDFSSEYYSDSGDEETNNEPANPNVHQDLGSSSYAVTEDAKSMKEAYEIFRDDVVKFVRANLLQIKKYSLEDVKNQGELLKQIQSLIKGLEAFSKDFDG